MKQRRQGLRRRRRVVRIWLGGLLVARIGPRGNLHEQSALPSLRLTPGAVTPRAYSGCGLEPARKAGKEQRSQFKGDLQRLFLALVLMAPVRTVGLRRNRFLHHRAELSSRPRFTPIGNVPPTEFEQQYYLAQEAPVMTAGVN